MKALLTLLMVIISSTAFGQTVPNSFSANTSAKAEEVNENFLHLANQFFYNKKSIDCSTDNLSQAIIDGFNYLTISGSCSADLPIGIGNFDTGILNKLYGANWSTPFPDIKQPQRMVIRGKTGRDTDSLKLTDNSSGSVLSVNYNGTLMVEGLTIIGNVYLSYNSSASFSNSKITGGSFTSRYNTSLNLVNSTVDHSIKLGRNSSMKADNVTFTSKISISDLSHLDTNEKSEIKDILEVENGSNVNIYDTTLSGSGVVIETNRYSFVEVHNSSVTNSGTGSCATGSVIDVDSDTTLTLSGCDL